MPRRKINNFIIIVSIAATALFIIFSAQRIIAAAEQAPAPTQQAQAEAAPASSQPTVSVGQPNTGGQILGGQSAFQGTATSSAPSQAAAPSISTQPVSQPQAASAPPAPEFTSGSSERLSEEEVSSGVKIDKKRISLDLKGIDIVELFRILSLKMNVTIVPTKSVTGRINIFLNNLTFEDALDVILISQDLACERKEDIINIMTEQEYERLYGQKYNEKRKFVSIKLNYAKPSTVFNAITQIKSDIGKLIVDEATGTIILIDIPDKLKIMQSTIKDLDKPLETEYFDIGYAKAADMKTHLSSAITAGAGELYVDERSGRIVVSDLPDKMKKIKRMVKAFDKETQQVFIEAEIVQVVLTDEYQRGINWEYLYKNANLHGLDFKGKFPVSPSFTPSPDLTTAFAQATIGTITQEGYTAALQMLKTYGAIKILSRPRISAVNNQEAKILVGTRDAYITQTLSQAQTTTVTSESVQFIDVGIKLNVVPTVNRDGFITMKIKPEVSSVGTTITTAAGSRIPIVDTSEAETVVKVKAGTMIMIAGLMKQEKRTNQTGMPLLSKIPLIGKIFDSYASQKKNTELIIFITPYIIRGDSAPPGTEPEKHVPSDFVPDDMQQNILERRIGDIKVKPDKNSGMLIKNGLAQPVAARQEKEDATVVAIQEKMKGLKKY